MIRWIFKGAGGRILHLAVVVPAVAAVAALAAAGCGKAGHEGPQPVQGIVRTPLADARVYIYEEGDDIYGPARFISEPTSADGSFSLSLKPGKYLAVVRKRVSDEIAGPVVIGDYRGDPVAFTVGEGSGSVTLELAAAVKVANEKGFPDTPPGQSTGISGRVFDPDGDPVEGVRVHIYDHIQMSERPKYVSERTGADGRFYVPVKRGGTYYLAARDRFGGPPQIGDLYGRYDEGTVDPSGVVVRRGEVTDGIEIRVQKVW